MGDTAYVAIGSNLGDRLDFMRRAVESLERHQGVVVTGRSSVYESPGIGFEAQPDYLNAVISVETDLAPSELLRAMLEVEARLGRTREKKWAPRTIDLDLLLYGDLIISEPGLVVPHAHMLERGFVLLPLCQINSQLLHPVRRVPIADFANSCNDGTVEIGRF
tara:strand:- start:309 stop:797 length:489 start_codon:yes stop_codon:yes gene_type:complete